MHDCTGPGGAPPCLARREFCASAFQSSLPGKPLKPLKMKEACKAGPQIPFFRACCKTTPPMSRLVRQAVSGEAFAEPVVCPSRYLGCCPERCRTRPVHGTQQGERDRALSQLAARPESLRNSQLSTHRLAPQTSCTAVLRSSQNPLADRAELGDRPHFPQGICTAPGRFAVLMGRSAPSRSCSGYFLFKAFQSNPSQSYLKSQKSMRKLLGQRLRDICDGA